MISSTIIVACRGAKRWFDLDAVRTEHQTPPDQHRMMTSNHVTAVTGSRADDGEHFRNGGNAAGAPPLDWHHDAPIPGVIVIGEPPDDERDDPVALAVKIIDCMCPRQVCRVCGVPRERIVDAHFEQSLDMRPGRPKGKVRKPPSVRTFVDGVRASPRANHFTSTAGVNNSVTRVTETLGWTDCGHNAYRKGRVFDPFGNPAIRAACELLDREYVTVIDTADL